VKYPVRKVFITQHWGVNPDVYSRFGFLGHNGIDLRIFDNNGNKASTGDLLAPHNGIIKEAHFDGDGYGHYYKIENDNEGSILAHNSELFFKVGDKVKEGQVIGKTGNTGWSTAPHVHWGYYRFPRNRSNGYGGTINQLLLLEGKDTMTELQTCQVDRKKFWDERDSLHRALGVSDQDKALSEISRLQKNAQRVKDLETEEDYLRSDNGKLRAEISRLEGLIVDKPIDNGVEYTETGKIRNIYDKDGKIVEVVSYKVAER